MNPDTYGFHKAGHEDVHPKVCAVTGFRLNPLHGYMRVMLSGLDGVCVGTIPGQHIGEALRKRLIDEYVPTKGAAPPSTPAMKPVDIPAEAKTPKTPPRRRSTKKDA